MYAPPVGRIDAGREQRERAIILVGSLRGRREAWAHSPESGIRDAIAPRYIFEGPGEILAVRDNYGQIRWHKPVPDVWLCLDQLEPF